ncbi:MAG: riboflavin biosynthesis protein RibF [Planctomycetota bacterium]
MSMLVFDGITGFTPPPAGITLTIGNFDGLHLGHRRIIAAARAAAADLGTPVVVMTFEPHPLAVLAPRHAPAQLTPLVEKLHLLETAGVDMCIVVRSTPPLLEKSADDFLNDLSTHCRPRAIIEGPDFNFGRERSGTIETLLAFGDRQGCVVQVVAAACCEELSERPVIRSSAIRTAVQAGQVEIARAMLGRPYRIVGRVGSGARRGAGLGYPTVNLEAIEHLLPGQSVYAGLAQLEDNSYHLAAVNVGPQPTFGPGTSCVEAYLLDWTGQVRGQRIGLYFFERLRTQQRFADASGLVAQIQRDVAAVRKHAADLNELASKTALPL